MAGSSETSSDFKAHKKSYETFTWLFKWGTILSALVALIVILIIST